MLKRSLRPTGRRPHPLVVSGLLVVAVTYGLTRYGFGLYLPRFRSDPGVTSGVAGGIAGGSYLAYCVAAVLGLRLVDRGRAREALWWAGGTAAAGSLVVAAANAVPVLAVGALVAGGGAGAASPALVAAVARTVAPPAGPRSQAVVNSGTGAGVVVGGLVALAWPAQWRTAWLGFAAVALLVTWWADRSARWGPPAAGAGRVGPGVRGRSLRRPLAGSVLAGAGGAGVWTFGADATTRSGLSAQLTGLLWCLLGAAALLGGLSGRLAHRAGLAAAWLVSVGAAATGTALLAWRPGTVAVAAGALALFGCGFVALTGVLIDWGGRQAPGAAAQATALLFTALTAGQAAGAVLLGALAGAAGTPAALAAAAVVLAAAALAAPRDRPRRRRPAARTAVRTGTAPPSAAAGATG